MTPKTAITREPGARYTSCISCHPSKATLNLARAREQHKAYRKTLSELGLEVILLDRDNEHPDSCFVEDTVVVNGGKALICRFGAEPRRGEEAQIEKLLRDRLEVRRTSAPGTIEGGDVMHLPDRLISGVTQRTNESGVNQASEWLGIKIDTIRDREVVHLKSYVTYLGNNTAVCSKRYKDHPALRGLDLLQIPETEAYAANTLSVAGTVLMSSGRPHSRKIVHDAGFEVVSLETSEFEKCEGALTCLSIIL